MRDSHSLYGGGGEPGQHTCLGQSSRTCFYQHCSLGHHEEVLRRSISLLFMCVRAFVSGFHVGAGGLGGRKRIVDAPGDGITGCCEPPNVGTGDWVQVLQESSKHSYLLNPVSNPHHSGVNKTISGIKVILSLGEMALSVKPSLCEGTLRAKSRTSGMCV